VTAEQDPVGAPAVYAAFLAVCADIDSITKSRRVQEGPARFAFRGVDDVMNALHGPMAKHSLICVPQVQDRIPESRQTRNGGMMNVVHLQVRFMFFGIDGSSFYAEAWGEGQDSGDKATGKAHSMAYKSALLQAFHVPTEDMPDADADTTPAEPMHRGDSRPASPPAGPTTPEDFLAALTAEESEARVHGLRQDAGLLDLLSREVAVRTAEGTVRVTLEEAFTRRLARLEGRRTRAAAEQA